IGAGAIIGAIVRSPLRRVLPGALLMPLGMALIGGAMLVIPRTHRLVLCCVALVFFGLGWLLVLSCANTAAQLALPVWVRARGLGIYLLVFSGAMAAGSALAGQLASQHSLLLALTVSGIGVALGAVLSALAPLPD